MGCVVLRLFTPSTILSMGCVVLRLFVNIMKCSSPAFSRKKIKNEGSIIFYLCTSLILCTCCIVGLFFLQIICLLCETETWVHI
jgi:hypothetical protein